MKLGVLGLGTVGSAVVRYVLEEGHERIVIKKIAVRDVRKKRAVKVSRRLLTGNFREILKDPEIDTVVELTGDEKVAIETARECLKRGKHFITATKRIISDMGGELFREARKKQLYIGYRATIVGLFPILSFIQFAMSSGKRIKKVTAVLNGTCNFVLDEMERSGRSYAEVIKDAVERGFAEPDPTADVSGYDSALKLKIILRLLFGNHTADGIRLRQGVRKKGRALFYSGIDALTLEDVRFASEMGYRMKLLGMIFATEKGYAVCVEPALVAQDTILASLRGPENGVEMLDDKGEVSGWFGHGAGAEATRIAVMQDIESILSGYATLFPQDNGEDVKIASYEDIYTRYFIKLYAMDKPGVLAKIAGVLGRNNINIASVMQKESAVKGREFVPLVITTYHIDAASVYHAVSILKRMNIVDSRKLSCYRIIDQV